MDPRTFKPHLTLARFKTIPEIPLQNLQKNLGPVNSLEKTIPSLELIESCLDQEGPSYRTLAVFPFLQTKGNKASKTL